MNRETEYKNFIDTAKHLSLETAFHEGYIRGYRNAEKLNEKTKKQLEGYKKEFDYP